MASRIFQGNVLDVLPTLPDQSVQCCVTSPPYFGLRDYGMSEQLGLEPTPDAYVASMVAVFREVRRVLKDDGTLWVNLGDSYNSAPVGSFNGGGFKDASAKSGGRDMSGVATSGRMNKLAASGLPAKNLLGIPWRVAFALQADGWYLRQDIIWHKPNPMPESVKDRCTKAHEYIFLLSKQPKYYYDWEAIAEPLADSSVKRYQHAVNTNEQFDPTRHKSTNGIQSPMEVMTRAAAGVLARGKKNKRTVWTIPTQNYAEAHFATFPEKLPMYCILAGSKPGDTVLDPFSGSATTGIVAQHFGRSYIGIELNPEYVVLSEKRLAEGSRYLEREYPQQTADIEAFPALD